MIAPAHQPQPATAANPAELNAHITSARLEILGQALVDFAAEIIGRSPTDDEIASLGYHAQFADVPLAVLEKDGKRFRDFYVFKGEALAHGFLNPKGRFDLSVCRLRKEEWPVALRLFAQKKAAEEVRGE